jgi:hypothetical protein
MTRWDRSFAPIPEGHIRLSEAFEAYYRAVTPNWRELDAAVTAADEKRGGKFFKKRDKPFFAAAEARDDARDGAAKKFIVALAEGELQPMIRDNGSNFRLSPSIWDNKADSFIALRGRQRRLRHPSLHGFDAIIDDHGHCQPIFLQTHHFQEGWLAKQGMTSAIAALKAGPDGGRPSGIPAVEDELARWINGGAERLENEMRRWTPKGRSVVFSKAGLTRALAEAVKAKGIHIKAESIEKATQGKNKIKSLTQKFVTALRLIKK